MQEFIGEDELPSYEQWLQEQSSFEDPSKPEQEVLLRAGYESMRRGALASPHFGQMHLAPKTGEYRFAVVTEDAGRLWIALWVRRSPKGNVYVLTPRTDEGWNPQVSYHADGWFHVNTSGRKFSGQWRQPPTPRFQGFEHLGINYGHSPKAIGAECNPVAFSEIVRVAPEIFDEPNRGGITIDLAAPGIDPPRYPWTSTFARRRFCHFVPHVVITVGLGQRSIAPARDTVSAASAVPEESL